MIGHISKKGGYTMKNEENLQKPALNEQIPYFLHEDILARMERTIERLWILCIILIVLLVGTNIAWICYENSFEDTVISQEVESDNGNAIVTDGVHVNDGASETNSEN